MTISWKCSTVHSWRLGSTRMSCVDAWSSWAWFHNDLFRQRVPCLWSCV